MKSFNVLRFVSTIMFFVLFYGGIILWQQKNRVFNHVTNHKLVNAILENDTNSVRAALKAGDDPNAEMEGVALTDFVHPLNAAQMGDIHIHLRDTPLLLTMDCLVKRNAKAVSPGNYGIPLENLETVKALVEAGAEVCEAHSAERHLAMKFISSSQSILT